LTGYNWHTNQSFAQYFLELKLMKNGKNNVAEAAAFVTAFTAGGTAVSTGMSVVLGGTIVAMTIVSMTGVSAVVGLAVFGLKRVLAKQTD
jgi:hypothetical protein